MGLYSEAWFEYKQLRNQLLLAYLGFPVTFALKWVWRFFPD